MISRRMLSFPVPREPRFLVALLLASSICFSLLRAQDVTVGNPVWLLPNGAPDELPKARSRLKPDYPDELRKTTETGYVIIVRYIDPASQILSLDASGTHVPFQRAVEAELNDWKMSPAKRGGQAVAAWIWLPIIFNPKAAASDAPDRIPRLLAVTPVFTPERPTPAGQPSVVAMRLSLDDTGAITKAEPVTEVQGRKTLATIQQALQSWRFAPGLRQGKPVAMEITVPVLCQQPVPTTVGKETPPKVLHQEEPEYPLVLQQFQLGGRVVIEFEVDAEGRVQNPVIASSDSPAFEEPALEALLKWKFQPATREGKAIKARMRVPVKFEMWGGHDGVFEISAKADQSKLPPELRYDVSPKIRGVQIPVYPYAPRRDEVRGKATAGVLIDPQGRVVAVKIRSADRPEFGLALTAALEGFTFDPALKDGKPVPHLLNFEQEFSFSTLPDGEGDRLLVVEKKHPENIVSGTTLDAPIKPVSRREPRFPRSVGENVTSGEAVIDCLIDAKGRVRLPRIVRASEPAFGYAAVQAVSAWWFEPPRKAGRPVVTRVRIPFTFGFNAPSETTASPVSVEPAESAPGK